MWSLGFLGVIPRVISILLYSSRIFLLVLHRKVYLIPIRLPLDFWSLNWDFVKDEAVGFFKEFFEHNRFVKSLNATFLVLVPKKGIVEDIKDSSVFFFYR